MSIYKSSDKKLVTSSTERSSAHYRIAILLVSMDNTTDQKAKTQFEIALSAGVSRMNSALHAFYIWKWINDVINTNSPGGKEVAEKSAATLNVYASVFQQIKVSCYKVFVADLSIFFDKKGYEDSFSITKLLLFAKEKISEVDMIELKKQIEKIRSKYGADIAFIQELRNADVAHQEMNLKSRKLIYKNTEELFLAIQKIINLISVKYNHSTWAWNHIEDHVLHELNWMLDNLQRGEKKRIEEIEQKWK